MSFLKLCLFLRGSVLCVTVISWPQLSSSRYVTYSSGATCCVISQPCWCPAILLFVLRSLSQGAQWFPSDSFGSFRHQSRDCGEARCTTFKALCELAVCAALFGTSIRQKYMFLLCLYRLETEFSYGRAPTAL